MLRDGEKFTKFSALENVMLQRKISWGPTMNVLRSILKQYDTISPRFHLPLCNIHFLRQCVKYGMSHSITFLYHIGIIGKFDRSKECEGEEKTHTLLWTPQNLGFFYVAKKSPFSKPVKVNQCNLFCETVT